jgi:hypothetical protein
LPLRCETGITSKQGLIDEFVGLVSGFLAVGATHVVSTLWTVDEISTALIMIRFYQLLKDMAPAQALKQAQHWLGTITYPQLAQWYLNLATPFADSDLGCWQNLQSLSRKAQSRRIEWARVIALTSIPTTGQVSQLLEKSYDINRHPHTASFHSSPRSTT